MRLFILQGSRRLLWLFLAKLKTRTKIEKLQFKCTNSYKNSYKISAFEPVRQNMHVRN